MDIYLELDDLAKQIYTVALNEASLGKYQHLTLEHFLYATSMFDVGRLILGASSFVSVHSISADLAKYLEEQSKDQNFQGTPTESEDFQELLEFAQLSANEKNKSEIEINDIIVSIFHFRETFASQLLRKFGAEPILIYSSYEDYKKEQKNAHSLPDIEDELRDYLPPLTKPLFDTPSTSTDYLAKYTVNMVAKARKGDYDPLIGRESELDQIILLLSRRTKHNPILVGDGGVGKTAIVQGLAKLIYEKEVPERLKNTKIYHIDMGVMLAGTKFRGDFEERLINTLEAASKQGDAVIYVDDIHTMVGAGTSSGGALDATSLVKPYLNREDLRFIGTTTYGDYKKHFEKSQSLTRLFQKVDISEPTINETIAILHGIADYFEKYHNIEYSNEALEAAAKLTAKYIHDARLPDKAIDAIDQAGAAASNTDTDRFVGIDEIEQAIAKMAKIPETAISADERQSLATLKQRLEANVFGQSEAVLALTSAITASRLGLNDPQKPIASLLFVGPTGVGKTEIARILAEQMNMPLTRFDMSEYQEQHAVSRLIGSPPGYIGHDQGGLLTDTIRKTPATVLLLDEIEKAHPSILNILLQAMDHGKLTDVQGKQADFRNVVLIMTSNAGARDASRNIIGFENKQDTTAIKTTVDKIFSPEFRNRLTKIIQFNPITEDMASKIAVKAIKMLEARLTDRGITLTPDKKALDHIAKHGFSTTYGAREIIRLVESTIKEQIATAMLKAPISPKTNLKITIKNNQLSVKI